jgi:multiple sugar transport system substrate-binding protein
MANYMVVGARQLGTQIISVDAEGNTVFDFPEEVARKLWDNYYVPYIYGYFSSVGRFRSDDVKTGNVIAFVGSSASASFFPSEVILSDEERYPIETGVMEAPGFADGEAVAVQQGAGMVVTKSDEEHVKASVEFLKWFTDTEQNIRFSIASGYLPVKKEANNVETIQKYMEEADTITETIEVSIDTVNNNILYTTPVTENGAAERNVLEYSLSDKAIADRAEIEEQAAATGASPREVAAEYDTDENFMQWYEDITTELQEAVS